jgi:L-threonylcarbamoyladenylate synthase
VEDRSKKTGTDIILAADILSRGGLVAIPTETVYGLAANGLDPKAVAKIFEAKKRPKFDPLILHTHSANRAFEMAKDIPDEAYQLASEFWPGPMTLVLKKRSIVPSLVSSGLDTVGLRVPNHPLTQELLQSLPFPLAAPSANPFGYVSPTKASHVVEQLQEEVDYVLDGGPSEVGVESTIIGFEDGEVTILRPGGLSKELIEDTLNKKVGIKQSTSQPSAPGMLESHYAPGTPMIIGDISENISKHPSKKIAYLSFNSPHTKIPGKVLSDKGDLIEAAATLFDKMRQLDAGNYDLILTEEVPNSGIGLAINDRLRRASTRYLR